MQLFLSRRSLLLLIIAIVPNRPTRSESTGRLFWSESNEIKQIDLDGSNQQTVLSGLVAPDGVSLAVDAGKIYWSEQRDPVIRRANLDGSSIETVLAFNQLINSIEIDAASGRIYWGSIHGGVYRARSDGTNLQLLVPTISSPGIALDSVRCW